MTLEPLIERLAPSPLHLFWQLDGRTQNRVESHDQTYASIGSYVQEESE